MEDENQTEEKSHEFDALSNEEACIYTSKCENFQCRDKVKQHDKTRLIVASVICTLFIITEVVGGILSNSLAIASDAAHLLTDLCAFLVSLSAIYISGKKRSPRMNFGYHRAEVLGALVSVLTIWLLTGIILYPAVLRLISQEFEIEATLMLIIAICGILANVVLGVILLYDGTCSCTLNGIFPKVQGINIRSAFIHVLGDFLYSFGILSASLVIFFKPEWKIVDPVCTVFFSFIVLVTTFSIMKDILRVLMEGFPKNVSFNDIQTILCSLPQVEKIHSLRMWSLTLEKVALSAHVVIKEGENPSEVLREAMEAISQHIDVHEVTLQIEES